MIANYFVRVAMPLFACFLVGCSAVSRSDTNIALFNEYSVAEYANNIRNRRTLDDDAGPEFGEGMELIHGFFFPASPYFLSRRDRRKTFAHVDVSRKSDCKMRWPTGLENNIFGVVDTSGVSKTIFGDHRFVGTSPSANGFVLEPGSYLIFVGYNERPLLYYEAELYCEGSVSVTSGLDTETSNPRFLALQGMLCDRESSTAKYATWWVDLYSGNASNSANSPLTYGVSSQGNLLGIDKDFSRVLSQDVQPMLTRRVEPLEVVQGKRGFFLQVTIGNIILFEQRASVPDVRCL